MTLTGNLFRFYLFTDMEEKVLYKINISGRVQGVGFRWSAAREARLRGINGFVRNLQDGNVYIEAEGSREQLDSFAEWCREGPGLVESVTKDSFPPVNYREFRIEY
jgi:acylphosphatase